MVPANPAMDTDSETQRLELAINANVLTDYVRENGMGGVDRERMAAAIEQTKLVYDFDEVPSIEDVFDARYLPAQADRMLE